MPFQLGENHFVLILFAFLCIFSLVQCSSGGAGNCYMHGPGTTIVGGDYRRDYGITRRECALACRDDCCCMAFVWLEDGTCTLKSRSLNATIEKRDDAYFGICIDYDDSDRDRLWDHEIAGPIVFETDEIARDACVTLCAAHVSAAIYSWRPHDNLDVDAELGACACVTSVHAIRLSFGAFAGFVRRSSNVS